MASASTNYSVGSAIQRVFERNKSLQNKLAELTVSVNTVLYENSQGRKAFSYPKFRVKSEKYRDIFNLIVATLFIKDQNVRTLLIIALQETQAVKNNPLFRIILEREIYLQQYLIDIVNKQGFAHLFSLLNFCTTKDNTKNIFELVSLRRETLGTDRTKIPEKRRIGVGYRDKGQLPLHLKGHNPNRFLDQRDLQNKIEKKRRCDDDFALFLQGWLD